MSPHKHKQKGDWMRLQNGVCACNSSQQNTHTHTHNSCMNSHLLCGCRGEFLSLVVLSLQHHSSTHSVDHIKQGGGGVLTVALGGPRIYGTHVLMEQTQGREKRSPVQSHVALHHIHQHSALSSGALGPSLQTALACAKHQTASQSGQDKKAKASRFTFACSVLSFSCFECTLDII